MDPPVLSIMAVILAAIGTLYMIWYTQRGPVSVLNDEEKMRGLISMFVKNFQYVLMGHASGDAKKTAKAKTLVANTLVSDVLPRLNPILGLVVNNTELGDWMLEDPDNTGSVISVLVDWFGKDPKGLDNIIGGFLGQAGLDTGSMATPDKTGVDFFGR